MIIDESLMLFDGYSGITSAGNYPSNIIDLRATANATLATGSYGMGAASPIYLVIALPTAFVGGTSVEFVVRTSDSLTSGALTSPTTLYDTGAILTASLTQGATVFAGILPINGVKQYIDINATGVGTFSAGTVSAFLTDNVQSLNIPLYSSVAGV
jgi:hypothetical protein